MTVQCVDCQHFDLRKEPRMAPHLLGLCKVGEAWQFHPAGRDHDCRKYLEAPEATRTARRAWMTKQKQQHHEAHRARAPGGPDQVGAPDEAPGGQ